MLLALLDVHGMVAQQNTASVIVSPTWAIAMSSQTKPKLLRRPW